MEQTSYSPSKVRTCLRSGAILVGPHFTGVWELKLWFKVEVRIGLRLILKSVGISCCCFKNCTIKMNWTIKRITEQSKGNRNPTILSFYNFKISGCRRQRGPNRVKWSSTAAAELQGWTTFFSIWLLFTDCTLCCERRHNHLRMKGRNQKKANNVQVDYWYTDINATLWLEWFLLHAVFIHMHLFFFYTSYRHSRMIMLVWRTNDVWIWPW